MKLCILAINIGIIMAIYKANDNRNSNYYCCCATATKQLNINWLHDVSLINSDKTLHSGNKMTMKGEHSFPRNAEFCAEPGNLPVSTEILRFGGIQYWLVIRGQIWHIRGKFAAVSYRIWQTGPRNLEKFAAENCGP